MDEITKGLLIAANLYYPGFKFDMTIRERHVYIFGHKGHERKEFMAEVGPRGKVKPIKSYSSESEWMRLV